MTTNENKQSAAVNVKGRYLQVEIEQDTDRKLSNRPGDSAGNVGSHPQQDGFLLQRVFEAISDPLILMDEDARVTMVNAAARKYYGVEMIDRVILHLCFEGLGQGERHCQSCRIPGAVVEGRRMDFEREGFKDRKRTERVELFPIHNESGAPMGAIMRIIDITDAKATQRQVDAIRKQASIGMLVSSVAHEIKNPNSFIAFNVSVLQEYFTDLLPVLDQHAAGHPDFHVCKLPYETFRSDVFNLLAAIGRGSKRIDKFLAELRQMGEQQDMVNCRQISIPVVIERVLNMVKGKIERIVKHFEVQIDTDIPDIESNADILEQVLINLLINAVHASDKKDAYIGLTAGLQQQDPNRVAITVKDNGHGMDQHTLGRIFEPFYSTKVIESGSGLGLYVCRKRLRHIGGQLEVESEPGQGSCFIISLPIAAGSCGETHNHKGRRLENRF